MPDNNTPAPLPTLTILLPGYKCPDCVMALRAQPDHMVACANGHLFEQDEKSSCHNLYLLIPSKFRVSFHVPYIIFQNVQDIMNLCIGNAVTWRGDVPCVTSGVI